MARRLLVEIVGDARSYQRAARTSSRATQDFERSTNRAARGALAGSGAFRSLGRSIAFASGTFLGFATAAGAITASIKAAQEQQQTLRAAATQLRAGGLEWSQYADRIERATGAMTKLGIEDDAALKAFTSLFRTTQNVTRSINDLQLVANIAAARHIDLQKAALLVAKVEAGNVALLRRSGIQVAKNATAEEALAEVRRRFAGQAAANVLPQEKLNAILDQTKEIIGGALLPVLNRYLGRLSNWLERMNRSGELQRKVNQIVRVASEVFGDLSRVVKTVTDSVGGAENAIKLLLAAMVVSKVAGFARALGDVAAAAGKIGRPGGGGRGVPFLPLGLPAAVAGAVVASAGATRQSTSPAFRGETDTPLLRGLLRSFGELTRQQAAVVLAYKRQTISALDAERALRKLAGTSRLAALDEIETLRARRRFRTAVAGAAGTGGGAGIDLPETTVPFRIRLLQAQGRAVAAARAMVEFIGPIVKTLQAIIASGQLQGQRLAVARRRLVDAVGLQTDAQKTLADAQSEAAERQRDASRKHVEAVKRAAEKQQQAAQEAAQKLRDATDRARQEIGTLFQGPVLAPSEFQRKMQLGVPGPDASKLLADIRAQTAQALRLERDLRRLRRAGVGAGTIEELRGLGTAALPQIEAILGARGGLRRDLIQALIGRERAARQIGQMIVHSPQVVVHADRMVVGTGAARGIASEVTSQQQRAAKREGVQRRGRHGGQRIGLG